MNDARRDRELIRYLTGELDAEASRELDRRLAADPDLAERFQVLRATWSALEPLAEETPAPATLAAEILERVRREPGGELWGAAPLWIRAGALAALPLGLALGLGLAPATGETVRVEDEGTWSSWSTALEDDEDGLAAAYYELLVADEDDDVAGVS